MLKTCMKLFLKRTSPSCGTNETPLTKHRNTYYEQKMSHSKYRPTLHQSSVLKICFISVTSHPHNRTQRIIFPSSSRIFPSDKKLILFLSLEPRDAGICDSGGKSPHILKLSPSRGGQSASSSGRFTSGERVPVTNSKRESAGPRR